MTPRITIVVPTRERCDTLRWALETCVTQDYDNLEIVVSDNASTDGTHELVASFDDPRIKYVNTDRRVKMAENWEFGLSKASPGYVGLLGDDDGVMPDGIQTMADLIATDQVDALIWPVYNYYWPGYVDGSLSNCLTMPARTSAHTTTLVTQQILTDVCRFERHVHWLPSIYWGVVSTAAIDRARSKGGIFLNSVTPDIYAGVAVAAVVDRHMRIGVPLTLSGESRHSNGAYQISGVGELREDSPSRQFLRENDQGFHQDLVYAANIAVLTGETILQARDHVPADLPTVDIRRMLSAGLRHPDHLFNPLVRDASERAMSQIANRYQLDDWFTHELNKAHSRSPARFARQALANVVHGAPLHACPADVDNIYRATRFARQISRPAVTSTNALVRDATGRFVKVGRGLRSVRARRALRG